MAAFDLNATLCNAKKRFASGDGGERRARKPRSDAGKPRIDRRIIALIGSASKSGQRPAMSVMMRQIRRACEQSGLAIPSRATIYRCLEVAPCPTYLVSDLPEAVRAALYNLERDSEVPGHQLAFYCFNYGNLEALSFASGLPWLALWQALRMPGHRPRSRGLLQAVAVSRGIIDGRA